MRFRRCRLRLRAAKLDPEPGRRQCAHAGNLRRHPARCSRLPGAAVQDHRHRGRDPGGADLCLSRQQDGHRLRARRLAVRRLRLHWHEHLGASQCANRPGRHQRHRPRTGRRVQRRRHHRHAGRGPGADWRGAVLLVGDWRADAHRRHNAVATAQAHAGLCLRLVIDLDLRAVGRRHFHQGRRRRRRPGGQGRSRHPGGRSAQSGGDCRQRG